IKMRLQFYRQYFISFRFFLLIVLNLGYLVNAQQTGALTVDLISDTPTSTNDFPIVSLEKTPSIIIYDVSDFKGVVRAIGDFQADIERVTGIKPELFTSSSPNADYEIIIGTLGKSKTIDKLVASGHLDVKDVRGKWETFVVATIEDTTSKGKKKLVIAGSDKRGTIYGIYELSRQLGVSPWYWWADVPSKQRASAYVVSGRYASEEPKVRY